MSLGLLSDHHRSLVLPFVLLFLRSEGIWDRVPVPLPLLLFQQIPSSRSQSVFVINLPLLLHLFEFLPKSVCEIGTGSLSSVNNSALLLSSAHHLQIQELSCNFDAFCPLDLPAAAAPSAPLPRSLIFLGYYSVLARNPAYIRLLFRRLCLCSRSFHLQPTLALAPTRCYLPGCPSLPLRFFSQRFLPNPLG